MRLRKTRPSYSEPRKAVEALKNHLSSGPVLAIYSPHVETELHCDASVSGFDRIVLQKQSDGMWRPVSFSNQRTTPAESKYHSFELECLAVIYAIKRFHVYLAGQKFKEHNGILLANATRGDFEKCVELATEGFRIWTEKSIDSKICILSKLTSILQTNEPLLANEISHWIKLAYYYKNHVNCHQNDKFEVTKIRIPKGVIFLEQKDAVTLFRELTQCLITGNAVIVICNPDVCTLVKYCDIFSTATIPSGVINLISSKIIAYMNYEKILEKSKPNSIYEQLTTTKHIVLCLK
ncbi:uncharacterized protein LOC114935814 [Nylanderia fulva]|uniref:uncharacterized protein LOC114935814 n=1 Tax=Nylanderia fulva TaxID=613905 RepID=UPI0010FAE1BF|nr:uncharacterized protein LOC114935814 [Nylanderia fulva]